MQTMKLSHEERKRRGLFGGESEKDLQKGG